MGSASSSEHSGKAESGSHAVLLDRIETRTATVGIIGMGYVGLPLACAVAAGGYPVVGLDVDSKKVDVLQRGESYILHITPEMIAGMRGTGRFSASCDFDRLADCDIILICVPTPLNRYREPDLSYVRQTADEIAKRLRPGQLVVLESTTYPGTTAELMAPILGATGLRSDVDFYLAYSPEREDPGNPHFTTTTIPKIVGGEGPLALDLAERFYASIITKVVAVSSSSTAEAVKLTENIFRAVNIALVNELKVIYDTMGIDVWEVIEAAKTKPFGFMPFYPGPGLGGHCVPIDPFYLTWKAREFGISTRFIELAGEVNRRMPDWVIDRLARSIDERTGRGLNGAHVLVLGVAYKKNIADLRESPSLFLISRLEERGARVAFHDPLIPTITQTRDHPGLAGRQSVPWDLAKIATYDAVLIATDHDAVDYRGLAKIATLIVDTRNVCVRQGIAGQNIVRA